VLVQKLFELSLFEDVVVPFVDHGLLFIVDFHTFVVDFLEVSFVLEVQVPGDHDILLFELFFAHTFLAVLLKGPNVDQAKPSHFNYSHELGNSLVSDIIVGEMVDHCYGNGCVAELGPHGEHERICGKELVRF
jgi:hypothetical protein